jgi:PEP-CTERM motif
MKSLALHRYALKVASGIALALGMVSVAQAVPTFSINPSALGLGGPAGPVQADAIGGSSSELLHTTSATTHSTTGWLSYSSFRLNSANLGGGVTGLNTDYGIYVVFTLTDHLVSGNINTVDSVNKLDTLNFQMFADPGDTDVFTAATATSETSISGTGNDILLGTGSLISGTSGFNSLGGAALNANTTFQLTANGSLFFIDPVPFYDMTFNGFNNTTQGVTAGPDGNIAINDASGTTDFNKVPEPGTLALLGLGLLGINAVHRRRKG